MDFCMEVLVTVTKKQADALGLVYPKTEDETAKVGCKIKDFSELVSLGFTLLALQEI